MYRLGRRPVWGMESSSSTETSEMSRTRWLLTVGSAIAAYFVSSISLTFFQKHLLRHLRFPLTMVLFHLVLKFGLATLGRHILSVQNKKKRATLSWKPYLSRVGGVAICSALDIGLSQWSFKFITVALYTMTKATSILFILFFALLFGLERGHWSLLLTVSMISSGLGMFVYHSTEFQMFGFILVLTASGLSGIRWTLAQMLMQRSRLGLEQPIDFIYHVQPLMIVTILPLAVLFEGDVVMSSEDGFAFHDFSSAWSTLQLMAVGGLLAFFMELFEFAIITQSSSLTLSVVGVVKEVCSILLDVLVNDTHLSAINVIGAIVCISGIVVHLYRKAKSVSVSSDTKFPSNGRLNSGQRGGDFELPLLSSDDDLSSSSEEDVDNRFREFDESFFLRDNRAWQPKQQEDSRNGDGEYGDSEVPHALRGGNERSGKGEKTDNEQEVLLADVEL